MWRTTPGGFLGDVPGAFQLCVSERQQDRSHRSSKVFNLRKPSLFPIYPFLSFFPSFPLRSLVSLSPFAFPLSPPPFVIELEKQGGIVGGGWKESKKQKQHPMSNVLKKHTSFPWLQIYSVWVVKVGGPERQDCVIISVCVCVFRFSCMTPH